MAHRLLLIGATLSVCSALAATEVVMLDKRTPVTPDSVWSITEGSCTIDQGWDGGGGITIMPHEDHFDLGIYDRGLKKVALGKVTQLMLGSNDVEADSEAIDANGVEGYEARGYVLAVQRTWLDRFERSQVLRLSRDRRTLVLADMPGLKQALIEMDRCDAVNSAVEAAMNATDAAADAAADAATAAEAAANAAEAAVDGSTDAMSNEATPR